MDWEAIGALGEIFGALAVVATLGYLAIQTKQNTAATHAATRQAILESDQQLLAMMIEQPSFDALRFTDELSPEEKSQLGVFFLMFTRMRESNWLQYNAGALDAETWASYRASIPFALGSLNGKKWWKYYSTRPNAFNSEFVAVVNQLLDEAPPAQPVQNAFDQE